jgi:hypothetical protein
MRGDHAGSVVEMTQVQLSLLDPAHEYVLHREVTMTPTETPQPDEHAQPDEPDDATHDTEDDTEDDDEAADEDDEQ